jgi:hypothetical protein
MAFLCKLYSLLTDVLLYIFRLFVNIQLKQYSQLILNSVIQPSYTLIISTIFVCMILLKYFDQTNLIDSQYSIFIFSFNKNLFLKIKIFAKKNPLYFNILFITCSLIISFAATYKTNVMMILYLVSIFCMCSYLFYVFLYYLRNLDTSLVSFISFFLAIAPFFSLCLFYFLLYPTEPLYLENLSYFSAIRHLIVGFILIILGILFIYKKKHFINPINPSAELQKIAYTWNNSSLLGKFSLFNLKKLILSKGYRTFYFIFDIFLNIIPKIITLWITLRFAFFSGDLREFFLLAPYLLFISCLSHIQYYMEYIIEGNTNVVKELVSLTKGLDNNNALFFKLTTEALNLGYKPEEHLPMLSQKWLELVSLSLFFNYKKNLKILSLLLSFSQIICWILISIYFFYLIDIPSLFASSFWHYLTTITKSPWIVSKHYFSTNKSLLAPPRDSGFLGENYQNSLKLLTKGEYGIGHPIVGELLPNGLYRVDGYLTHGKPPKANILYNVLPYSLDPYAKNKNPQHFVAFTSPVYINPSDISKKIQGSQLILENPKIKLLLETFLNSIKK